jgi:hypothetical protein
MGLRAGGAPFRIAGQRRRHDGRAGSHQRSESVQIGLGGMALVVAQEGGEADAEGERLRLGIGIEWPLPPRIERAGDDPVENAEVPFHLMLLERGGDKLAMALMIVAVA